MLNNINLQKQLRNFTIRVKARFGIPSALFELSSFYLYGINAPEDHQKAYDLLKKASRLGFEDAQNALETMYDMKSNHFNKDFEEIFPTIKDLKIKADKGDAEALFLCGASRVEEEDTSLYQYKAGLKCIKEAAKLNHPEALFILGTQLMMGIRNKKNRKKGFDLIKQSANLDCKRAVLFLMKLTLNGGFIETAFPFIEKAAAFGDPEAINLLSECYINGTLVKQDIHQGLDLLLKSAKMENVTAQYNLAIIFEFGKYGIPQDIRKAIYWHEKAVAQNDTMSMNNLSAILYQHPDVEHDYNRAFQLSKKAFELGDIMGLTNMGYYYKRGIGVKQDTQKALECYQLAFEKGEKNAAYNLYVFYSDGIAIEPDLEKATYWKTLSEN